MSSVIDELSRKRDELLTSLDDTANRIAALPLDAPEEERKVLDEIFERDNASVQRLTGDIRRREKIQRERQELQPQESDEPGSKPTEIRVGKEPLVYERGNGPSFFHDLRSAAGNTPDPEAQDRLRRHAAQMRVEMRDISSTAGAGGEFVPPKYLQDQWIPLLRASRPTADAVTRYPLQPGTMSYNLPKLTGGGATAIQSADNAAVQETDPTTAIVTATVKTVAGQVDVSRQLFEFSNPGIDEILFTDLARDYATKLDIQVLSGTGSSGQALGIRNVSGINSVASGATATAAAIWPKVADAIQRVTTAFMQPDTIVMHPRRVAFFLAALDSQNRPFFNATGPYNAMGGSLDNTVSNGVVGNLQGLQVISDPNIPTNLGASTTEDIMIVFDSRQLYLWEEGAPRTRVFEDIGSQTLTVRLSCFGFFAFMGNRLPGAISVITGAALVTPTF